jgi:hypothetical protein
MSPSYRLTRPARPDAPRRHVIEEYRHRAQTVTCACGWHGSTAPLPDGTSDWSKHVSANRGRTF